LVAAVNGTAYDESFYRAMELEAKGVEFEADRFAASTNDIRTLIQAFGDDGRLASLSKEQVVAQMRAVAALEREYVQAIGLSAADYQTWLTKLQTARQSNPLIDALMPAFDTTLERTRGAVVQHAMAVAGLQVLVSGPSVLSQHLDPASGRPFQYQVTTTGFTLTSSFQSKGGPVSMNFHQ
jgi:phosphoglycolate phosphatase-like HAD superfamily hydrolase